jgi:hypothetical protein
MCIETVRNTTTPTEYKILKEVVSKNNFINFKFACTFMGIETSNFVTLFEEIRKEIGN